MPQTYLDNETWRYFWHPVCTEAELDGSDTGRGALLQAYLLGEELVIARLSSGVVAMNNRCPHRSAKLHLGWNPLQKIEANAFDMIPQLVDLDLSNCGIKRIAAKAFVDLEQLQKVKLNNNKLSELRQRTVDTIQGTLN